MKRSLFIILCTLCTLTLLSCASLTPSPHPDLSAGEITAQTQFAAYAPDAEFIHVALHNGTDEELTYGAEWSMEVRRDDGWYTLPYVENAVWNSLAYILMPGGSTTFTVHTGMLDYSLKAGTYRIIKMIDGTPCAAEFTVSKDGVGADNPYGYAPLESLPDNYTKEAALADGVILVEDSLSDTKRLTDFFSCIALGMNDQIRLAEARDDGSLIITDMLAERKLGAWRIRVSVDDGETVTTDYYSHFLYFNGDLAVGNTAAWSMEFEDQTHFLLAENKNGEVRTVLTPWLDSLAGDGRSAFWSPDGMKLIRLSDTMLEFGVSRLHEGGGESGSMTAISQDINAKAIRGAVWEGDSETVVLICDTDDENLTGYVFYSVTENKEIGYTSSFYGYVREDDGSISILE